MTLGRTIPALPAHDVAASVAFYRDKLGHLGPVADLGGLLRKAGGR